MTAARKEAPSQEPAEERGFRQFRILVLFFSGLFAAILAVASMLALVACLRNHASADDILRDGFQASTTLTYYLVWLAVAAVGLILALRKSTTMAAFYVNLAITAELCAYGYFAATNGHLYRPVPPVLYGRFDPRPFVVATPHPNLVVYPGYTHDAEGNRTTINQGKRPDARTILVFGGSTAYDVVNTDADTWPSQLSALLGPGFVVKNLGVPGFSSAEALARSLFVFRDDPPACAIYYLGVNDLRNSHADKLASDYSNFEYPYLYEALHLSRTPGFLERNSLLISYLASLLLPAQPVATGGTLSGEPDPRVARIFRDNVRLIGIIGHAFGVQVIFVPAVVNDAAIAEKGSQDKLEPYIRAQSFPRLLGLMNQDLSAAAAEGGASFVDAPLSRSWLPEDFFGPLHFDRDGARKFARSIAESVRRICQ